MKRSIVKYGSHLLRKHSQEILPGEDYSSLIKDLFDSLNTNEGIGLAAPQIGVTKRAFIIAVPIENQSSQEQLLFKRAFVNPSIISVSEEKVIYNEGCLSIPDIFENVLRPEKVVVNYFDEDYKLIEEKLDGIVARVFQHEFDHLNGILFIDHINSLKRRLLFNKLNRIKKNR